MSSSQSNSPTIKSILAALASAKVIFYSFPWLMVLLIIGTIAQKEMGIFTAQKLYFSSWIVWLGLLPMPGAYLTLGFISASLLVKFIGFSPWQKSKTGNILSHFGVLLLMVGGLLTAATQKENFIMLREGQEAASVSDYHARVLTIQKDEDTIASLPFEKLEKNGAIDLPALPFSIEVLESCANCQPVMNQNAEGKKGFAQKVSLEPKAPEKENEANMSGITFRVSGADEKDNGIYIAVEEIPMYPEIHKDGATYILKMGRAQHALPFSITLDEFTRDLHPGTEMARGFSSHITLKDGEASWPYTISMNSPLRYKGYTFYQSSFSIRPDGEFSILSVVQNKGRVFPYIASAVLFAGLLTHLLICSRTRKREMP